jgi:PKD repeat protein
MKKIFYLTLLCTALFSSLTTIAGGITVKGYVRLANGNGVANVEVKIAAYVGTSTAACKEEVVVTNSVGFYSKEISCTGDIHRSRISLKNCDGAVLALEKEVPVSKVIEANFTVCQTKSTACVAKFTAEPVPASSTVLPYSARFNGNSSETGNGENIIHRTWDFHDGTALLNDRVDPLHTFPRSGTYEVCLTIKTVSGCESKVCKQVIVPQTAATTCTARFTFERLGPKKFRFNSSSSVNQTEDNIVERKWDFRDGTVSNDLSPAHEFAKPGNYEVCLTIKTARGCESRFCAVVKVEQVAPPDNDAIQIISLYPTQAHENLKVVVLSKRNNVLATVAIVDAYGVVRSSKQYTLVEGYNPLTIPVNRLTAGSYFIKVTTQFGVATKPFYKL